MEQGEGRRAGGRMQGRRGPITHCALGHLPVCCVCLPACQTAAALSNVKGALGGAAIEKVFARGPVRAPECPGPRDFSTVNYLKT